MSDGCGSGRFARVTVVDVVLSVVLAGLVAEAILMLVLIGLAVDMLLFGSGGLR